MGSISQDDENPRLNKLFQNSNSVSMRCVKKFNRSLSQSVGLPDPGPRKQPKKLPLMLRFPSMPFVDLTLPERERFLKQATGCHIPGYTGHCPTLKFRYGKRYGADTREIIEQFRDLPPPSPVKFAKPYKQEPRLSAFRETTREKGEEIDPIIYASLPRRPFILGYTGYIPGLHFEFGAPFYKAANKSVVNFTRRLAEEEKRRQLERRQCVDTMSRMKEIIHYDSDTRPAFKANESHIAPDLPPLTGYTGHIPGVKGNEASLSKRYHSAAKAGLSMLKEQRNRNRQLDMAKEAVADAMTYSRLY